jgi:hypothetical protein
MFAMRGISNTQIIFKTCLGVEETESKFAPTYCAAKRSKFWPPPPIDRWKISDGRARIHDQTNNALNWFVIKQTIVNKQTKIAELVGINVIISS